MFRLSVESAPFGRVGLKCGSEERREGKAPPLRGFKKAFRFCVGEPLGAPARIRTGSVGSAKSGAVVEPHRPQFSAQPGPGGPAGIQTLTQILRAGTFLPDPRGNPRKWGPGKGDYEHEVLIWSRPRRFFGDFLIVEKVTRRPQAAKPPCKKRNCSIIAPSSVWPDGQPPSPLGGRLLGGAPSSGPFGGTYPYSLCRFATSSYPFWPTAISP